MRTTFIVNHKVVQPCSSTTNICEIIKVHTNWFPEDLPLGSEQSKCHLNTDPQLAQIEVVRPVSGDVFCCTTEWDEEFIRQGISIVTNKEAHVRQIVDPLSQLNASIECSGIICPAWSDDTKVNESKVSIHHRLNIDSTFLVMSAEAVRCVVNILWFVDATQPTVNATNTTMEHTKGCGLFIPFRGTPFQLFRRPRNIDGE